MTEQELQEIREAIADCGCGQVSFCDAWGCCTVAALLAEVERLRAALWKYGRHDLECGSQGDYPRGPCTCGLDAILGGET